MSSDTRTVMITGAAGNLGRSVAHAFHASGASVVLVDQRRESLVQAFGTEDERRCFAPANLLRQDEVDSVVLAAMTRFGRIDVLCNLAGGFRMGEAVHETRDQTFDFLFDINVRTLLHTVRAVVPRLIDGGGGHIVNVGALSARQGLPGMGAYCASKDAVIRLSESLAAELGPKNIQVNCVLPSIIDTPENRAAMPDADPAAWVAPDDIARTIQFLTSDQARAVHGVSLPLTGRS